MPRTINDRTIQSQADAAIRFTLDKDNEGETRYLWRTYTNFRFLLSSLTRPEGSENPFDDPSLAAMLTYHIDDERDMYYVIIEVRNPRTETEDDVEETIKCRHPWLTHHVDAGSFDAHIEHEGQDGLYLIAEWCLPSPRPDDWFTTPETQTYLSHLNILVNRAREAYGDLD